MGEVWGFKVQHQRTVEQALADLLHSVSQEVMVGCKGRQRFVVLEAERFFVPVENLPQFRKFFHQIGFILLRVGYDLIELDDVGVVYRLQNLHFLQDILPQRLVVHNLKGAGTVFELLS